MKLNILAYEAPATYVASFSHVCYCNYMDNNFPPAGTPLTPDAHAVMSPSSAPANKKFPWPAVLLPALFLLILSLIGGIYYIQYTSKLKLGVVIAYTEGDVEYQKNDGGWKTADIGFNLGEGDQVRVLSLGRAILNLDDGSAIRLNSDTLIKLDDLSPNNIVVSNIKGEIYTRVSKSKRTFLVKTPAASYQALGTAFKTLHNDDRQGVEVYESQVKILGADKNKDLLVYEGNQYYMVNAKKPDVQNAVTQIKIEDIKKDEFTAWNKEQDEKVAEFKDKLGILNALSTPTPTSEPTVTLKSTELPTVTLKPTSTPKPTHAPEPTRVESGNGTITLTGSAVDNGILLKWTVVDMTTDSGFKIIKSKQINPVYPGNDFQYLSSPSAREYKWNIKDGETYHFRVCKYLGGSCVSYSNDISVKAPSGNSSESTGNVSSITLKSEGENRVSWTVNGTSPKGFKVVWSKNSNPTYPLRNDQDKYHYFDSPSKRDDTLESFAGSGTYHVRVCEYLGGSCGIYSNEIEISL